jgi:hypothetical protein
VRQKNTRNSRKYLACTKNFTCDEKWGKKTPEIHANTEPVLGTLLLTKSEAKNTRNSRKYWAYTKNFNFDKKWGKKTPEIHANTEPVLRTLTLTKSEARKHQKFTQILSLY